MENEQSGFDIMSLLGIVRRRAVVIAFLVVLTTLAAYGVSNHEATRYTATATLVFNNNEQAQQVAGLQTVAITNAQAQQQTNLKLVQRGDMAERAASRLGLTADEIREDLAVAPEGESNLVDVSATATSPTLAAAIANVYVAQFVAEQQSSNHAYYASALALVNRQLTRMSQRQRLSPAGLALEGRAQSLGVLAELRNGNVEVVQRAAVPTAPSSPKTARNTVLGALLGLVLGLGVAVLLERVDRRIREPKDLEAIYGLPLLGAVSESKALARSGGRRKGKDRLPASELEAFQLIRAHLRYFNVDREVRTLMVVSAAPGDGKTTVSRHLATAAVQMGSRVLLLEADLRRPTLAAQMGMAAGPGLTDVLIGTVPLNQALRRVSDDQGGTPDSGSGDRTLDVLVCGMALPPNPAELIESHAMALLLEHVKSLYDLVVIDTPPLTAVSDAFPLLGKVDGVVIVGRMGRNERGLAQRLHETLKGVDAPLLGVVANGVKTKGFGGYSYAYSYDDARRAPRSASDGVASNGAAPEDGALQRSSS